MGLVNRLKQKVKTIKSDIHVLILAYSDNRTPILAKILIGVTVGYLLSPIDLIPDFIPILGLLDDLILVPLLIVLSIRLIPTDVLSEARERIKNSEKIYKKNNWVFASIIILIWLILLYSIYQYLK